MDELIFYTDGKRHLICTPYSIANLHKMAEILNIKSCWFHYSSKFPHYDIPKRRIKEIEDRCIIVSTRQLMDIIRGN